MDASKLLYYVMNEVDKAIQAEESIDTYDFLKTLNHVLAKVHARIVIEGLCLPPVPSTYESWARGRGEHQALLDTIVERDREIADLKAEIKGITADFQGFREQLYKDIADLRGLGGIPIPYVNEYKRAAFKHQCPGKDDAVCTDALARVIEVAVDRACASVNHLSRVNR